MNKVVRFRRWTAKERLRDQLEVARAILRKAIDGPIDEDLLTLVEDVAEDLHNAVNNFRNEERF
jgi:hypothetical protein